MPIDLNADVGESGDADDALFAVISSASVAAGGHAGSPDLMRLAMVRAKAHGVAVGAHPSFPDRAHFGRRDMHLPVFELEAVVGHQVAAVAGVAAAEGLRLQHVKPHGALYNMAARDPEVAGAIVRAVTACDPTLIVFGPPHSALLDAARDAGLSTAAEGFADRAYRADGSLAPRSEEGAVIADPVTAVARALRMAIQGKVSAIDGTDVHLRIDTLCVHGDTPDAAAIASQVRRGLESAGIRIAAFR